MTRTPIQTAHQRFARWVGAILLVTLIATPTVLAGTLDEATSDTLQHMALDEKLAHDVYTTLAKLYEAPAFTMIAASEATHLEAIQGLLDRYGVEDPTLGSGVGEFSDPAFQALYDDLVAAGSASLEAAAGVGVTIEEIDIADLQAAIDAAPTSDIARVYGNLLAASESHLEAFTALEADPGGMQVGSRPAGVGGLRDDAPRAHDVTDERPQGASTRTAAKSAMEMGAGHGRRN